MQVDSPPKRIAIVTILFCIALFSAVTSEPAEASMQSSAVGGSAEQVAASPSAAVAMKPTGDPSLTLKEAEQLALQNNPRVSIAYLEALAGGQMVREKRSALLPNIAMDATGAEAYTGSRIGASAGLSDSRLFTHVGMQTTVSQMVTDFGRTSNLVVSARLSEKADEADALAAREDVVLITDRAFFGALQAQAMSKVAQRHLVTRQAIEAQIDGLLHAQQRSTLDLGLAKGNTVQAQVQLLDAESAVQTAVATLAEVLGLKDDQHYTLVDDPQARELPSGDEATLLRLAMQQRPDLLASNLRQQAAKRYTQAEADRIRPTISIIGTVGGEPVRPGRYFISSWNGAVGANINIPIFDGFLYSAQMKEVKLRAQITDEQSRLLRNRIMRDIRTARLQAEQAFQRVHITEQMLGQANNNLTLAKTQYELGRTSYMELSNAELQQADADVSNTNAQYLYQMSEANLRYQVGNAQ